MDKCKKIQYWTFYGVKIPFTTKHQWRTKRADSHGVLYKVVPYCYWCDEENPEIEFDTPIPGDKNWHSNQ